MKQLLLFPLFLLAMLISLPLSAQLQVADIFTDHMVLQREREMVFWGWTKPKEKVSIRLGALEKSAKADVAGRWELRLPAQAAGGPFEVIISSKSGILQLEDVWIGEVWICSGQSNMEWPLSAVQNAEAEVAAANYPMIRMFNVANNIQLAPVDRLAAGSSWKACTPDVASSFSAVAYFMARKLQQELGIAIGLIGSNWGGTIVETWISAESIKQDPDFKNFSTSNLRDQILATETAAQTALNAFYDQFPDEGPDMRENEGIWSGENYATTNWKSLELPGLWEGKGLINVDGVVWFRKEFQLSPAEAAAGGTLSLGAIDDEDITWINGVQVGATQRYDAPRNYEVPPAVLKAGRNVIAVRVNDTGGGGGFSADLGTLMFRTASQSISLDGFWAYRPGPRQASGQLSAIRPNDAPTLLYNGMIHPLVPFGIGGVIWYQGESNAGRAYQYRRLFPLLIEDWRRIWGYEFPFLWVQLANFTAAMPMPGESDWAELREAQSMTLSLPNTAQAVTIDIGVANDIHPRNKQDVGLRLALAALHTAYGQSITYSGPTYQSMKIADDRIILSFEHVGGGLMAKDRYGYLKGFAIAGADKQWHWAQAEILGNTISVFSPQVPRPVAVRYAWAKNPDDANLFNQEGLPASPFRTDDWKGITEK